MFGSHIYGDSRSLGAEFLTYSDTARPVLPYGTVLFGSRASNPTRLPLRECLDPIFTETAGPLGPNFIHILTQRVQFYLMVQFSLARALPTSLGYPSGNVWIPYLRGQQVRLAEFFTYSDTARPVLHYGTVFVGSRATNPTRLPLRECLDPIFTGTAGPLGPNVLHILTQRVQFYLMVQFSLARALPTPLGYPSKNVWIPYLRGQQVQQSFFFP